jgi:hypothetical protein
VSLDVFLARITKRRTPVAITDSDLSELTRYSLKELLDSNGTAWRQDQF